MADKNKDKKVSLEDILCEYTGQDSDTETAEKEEQRRVIRDTLEQTAKIEAVKPAEKKEKKTAIPQRKEKKNDSFNRARRSSSPADEFKPTDLTRKKTAAAEPEPQKEKPDPIPHVQEEERESEIPAMIRPMSDSTRAKEAQRQRKKKKRRKKGSGYTYKQETAVGEYVLSPEKDGKKKYKKNDTSIKGVPDAVPGTEPPKGREVTDIVPAPEETDMIPVQEINDPAELGDTGQSGSAPAGVKVSVRRVHGKKQRTRRIVDFNYYGDVEDVGRDITELTGIISSRVLILVLAAFLSIYITLCSQFDLPIVNLLTLNHVYIYMTVQFLLGAVAAVASLPVMTKGIKNLFTGRADSDSLTAATAAVCLLAMLPSFFKGGLVQNETIRIYMPVGILALLTNALGKLLIVLRAKRNFGFVSKEFDRHAVVYVRDEERAERLTRGTLGDFPILAAMRKTSFITDFLRYSYSSDITDSYCRKAVPLCLIFSAAVSLIITLLRGGMLFSAGSAAFFFSLFSMLVSAAACTAMPFVVNIPLENASVSSLRNKGIILGYQSVDDLYDANSLLITADKLFPAGTVRMDEIKLFSNTKLDEAMQYAASLASRAGSVMTQVFGMSEEKGEKLLDIENYSYEDGLGVCGWLNNKRVLLGSREHMINHSIEGLPTKNKEAELVGEGREALYLSVSGNISALFTVSLRPDRYIKRWFKKLHRGKVCVVVRAVDPCISSARLASLMEVPEDMIKVLPKRLHEDFDAETKNAVRLSASLACTGRFTSMAQLLLGIKSVHASAVSGLLVQTVSILLGLGLGLLLILSKAFAVKYAYMSAAALVIYNLFFTVLTYLIVSIRKP